MYDYIPSVIKRESENIAHNFFQLNVQMTLIVGYKDVRIDDS